MKILNHQLQFLGNRNFNWIVEKLVRALINTNFYLTPFHTTDEVEFQVRFFKSGLPCRPNPLFQKFAIRRKRKNRRKYIRGA